VEFSAALRLPGTLPATTRATFVNSVLDLLELDEIQGRLVGSVGSPDGLAPGERKRLTIAVELVSNAPVIFLDGEDST